MQFDFYSLKLRRFALGKKKKYSRGQENPNPLGLFVSEASLESGNTALIDSKAVCGFRHRRDAAAVWNWKTVAVVAPSQHALYIFSHSLFIYLLAEISNSYSVDF